MFHWLLQPPLRCHIRFLASQLIHESCLLFIIGILHAESLPIISPQVSFLVSIQLIENCILQEQNLALKNAYFRWKIRQKSTSCGLKQRPWLPRTNLALHSGTAQIMKPSFISLTSQKAPVLGKAQTLFTGHDNWWGLQLSYNCWIFTLQQCITSRGHKHKCVPERSSGHHLDLPQPTTYKVLCKLTHTQHPDYNLLIQNNICVK